MINRNFNFKFDELIIDIQGIFKALGYPDSPLPDPFDAYLEEAIGFAYQQTDIRAAYIIIEDVLIDEKRGTVLAAGTELHVSKTVSKELRGAEKLAFFVCTAGKTISEKSSNLLKAENPVLGYVYDLLGTYIAEATGDRMQLFLKEEFMASGFKITNCYSPGYCHWNVADQHKLFSFFPEAPCGVILNSSALMSPVKSISGVIGIGHEVKYSEYQCERCLMKNCIYNNR